VVAEGLAHQEPEVPGRTLVQAATLDPELVSLDRWAVVSEAPWALAYRQSRAAAELAVFLT
jgi:hypothetical protein